MKRAEDLLEFAAEPIGRYIVFRHFLCWCEKPELYGYAVWGCPGEGDVRRLVQLLDLGLSDRAVPHDTIVDLRRVDHIDASAFGVLFDHVRSRRSAIARCVRRQGIVRPTGLVGATIAGFYSVIEPPHPALVSSRLEDVFAWLGHEDVAGVCERHEALLRGAMGVEPVLHGLRRVLVPPFTEATLAGAASALGVSERTLQRRLRDAGTTFQIELNAAQVNAAKQLLRDTDLKLAAIAIEVGCCSLQQFSGLFHRVTGESPSAWRERHRDRAFGQSA